MIILIVNIIFILFKFTHSKPHNSMSVHRKSVSFDRISLLNVWDLELLPFKKSSVKNMANLPKIPPPTPKDVALPH